MEYTEIKRSNVNILINIILGIASIYCAYFGYQSQKENNDLQMKLFINETINNRINHALDLITEGEILKNELADRNFSGESISIEEKKRSYDLIKAGIDTLESIKNVHHSTTAIKHLIRFYSYYENYERKVTDLRNELLNNKTEN